MGDLGAVGFVIPVSLSVLGVLGKKWGEEMASPPPLLKTNVRRARLSELTLFFFFMQNPFCKNFDYSLSCLYIFF